MKTTMETAKQIIRRNNVKIGGQGQKVLVFAHGFGCDQYVWDNIAPAFESKYRVVLFDYVGSGKSDKTAYEKKRYRTLHGYKQDLLELCDALSLENIVFIGHSVSSMIGALAAVERPELMKNLIMIGPSPYFLNEPGYQGGFEQEEIEGMLQMIKGNYNEFARFLSPIVMQNAERPHLAAEFEQLLCANDPQVMSDFAEATFLSDTREDLAKVTVPTLILQSRNDAVAPESVGEYVHSQIDNSEYKIIDAEGHSPHISHAEETVSIIAEYLSMS